MYATLNEIAKKYRVSPRYIKKYELVEGEHFILIGSMKRYDMEKMHKLLVTPSTKEPNEHPLLEKFLIES